MNERKLLTEQQIFRCKTAAIWLLGAGLFISYFGFIAENWLWEYLAARSAGYEYLDILYHVLSISEVLFMVWGLALIKRLADPNAAVWVKHWIIAYIGVWILVTLRTFSGAFYNLLELEIDHRIYWFVWWTITSALLIAFALYLLWAIDGVRESSSDKQTGGYVRALQAILVATVLVQCVSVFLNLWNTQTRLEVPGWNGSSEFWWFANSSLWRFWKWIGIALFFVSLTAFKGLIRSNLFASNADEITAFAEQPKPETPFFTASVWGAIMALALCAGGAWLVIANWGRWTTEIFW